jgi:hypothetical protein
LIENARGNGEVCCNEMERFATTNVSESMFASREYRSLYRKMHQEDIDTTPDPRYRTDTYCDTGHTIR